MTVGDENNSESTNDIFRAENFNISRTGAYKTVFNSRIIEAKEIGAYDLVSHLLLSQYCFHNVVHAPIVCKMSSVSIHALQGGDQRLHAACRLLL